MTAIAFLAGLMIIAQSANIFKGNYKDANKKYVYGALVVILGYLVIYAYPEAEPLGTFRVPTEVNVHNDSFVADVDICIDTTEEEYFKEDEEYWKTIKVYKPVTIYWSNGEQTNLNPDETDYAKTVPKYVWASGYNEDEVYSVYIPKIPFDPKEKLLAMGWYSYVLFALFLLGIIASCTSAVLKHRIEIIYHIGDSLFMVRKGKSVYRVSLKGSSPVMAMTELQAQSVLRQGYWEPGGEISTEKGKKIIALIREFKKTGINVFKE